jgi:DNA repair exonuclease SbcCD ATPase subunit
MTPQNSSMHNQIEAIEQRLAELEYERNSLIQKRDDLIQKSESDQDSRQPSCNASNATSRPILFLCLKQSAMVLATL